MLGCENFQMETGTGENIPIEASAAQWSDESEQKLFAKKKD